ncbi:MAG: 4Fe-4S binding protein [Tissierellia bacterium]|nr:4Fe-4S binding protein [Tissierellia bacterium]MDD4779441.1 4Fe-4S binding protein [Tissierellia bacterium]
MKYFVTLVRLLFLSVFLFLVTKGNMVLWLGIFAVSLVAALIFGRIYCGYVCPMNTAMIPTEWISKKLTIQTSNTPNWLKSGKFSWITLLLSIILVIASKKVLHKNFPFLIIWLVIAIIITMRYEPKVFHNLICPFGALQKTFGKFTKHSKTVVEEECIGCKLCEKSCPSAAIKVTVDNKKANINTSLCHQCTNCQQVCPKNAIQYMNITNKKQISI